MSSLYLGRLHFQSSFSAQCDLVTIGVNQCLSWGVYVPMMMTGLVGNTQMSSESKLQSRWSGVR